jgi:hypothetical protein
MPKVQEHIFGDVQDVRYAENAGAYFRRCSTFNQVSDLFAVTGFFAGLFIHALAIQIQAVVS